MPELFPKISIVTASYNQVDYIEESILSVIGQNYPNLEYIIIDGGSTDGTVEIIKKYADKIHYWISEKDAGLYYALQKGLSLSTGEIMGWLNSDDILHRRSLDVLAGIFSTNDEIDWLQGYPNVIDESGRIVFHRQHRYSKYSFYGKEYHDGLFIQQESTYWRRSLWEKAGSFVSNEYKFAGDFELWIRFFNYSRLYITRAMIGAFRVRPGQLSAKNYSAYLSECDSIIDKTLEGLPAEQRAVVRKRKFFQKIRNFFPRIGRLINTDRLINRLDKPGEVNFDFDKSVFRP
jgi:glycosyltransferase involved in cell wall biosynthesis